MCPVGGIVGQRAFASPSLNLGHNRGEANPVDRPPGPAPPALDVINLDGRTKMRLILFLALIAVPLAELALLIQVGRSLGLWPTLLVVVATGLLGASLLHRQGLAAFDRAIGAVEQGKPPIEPVFDGFLLALAGALLLAPGLMTDTAGLLLLVPPVRTEIARRALSRLLRTGSMHVRVFRTPRNGPGSRRTGTRGAAANETLEGEFERLDETTAEPRRKKDGAGS